MGARTYAGRLVPYYMGEAQHNQTEAGLKRSIGWQQAFWLASGVSALVLFSIGGISATVGTPSWLIWIISVSFGFLQAFTFAEISGLYPKKSGGVAVSGALVWMKYAKIIGPLSVWSCWLAWTSVLAIGAGLAAGYVLDAFFEPDASIMNWELQIASLDFINQDLKLRLNATFFIGAIFMTFIYWVQSRGVAGAAKFQAIFGLAVIIPLLIVGIMPFFNGVFEVRNLVPLVPINGAWDQEGWALILGGLFIAAWSTYAFETAACYTGEFKNPRRDTPLAIMASGLLCVVIFSLVPMAFQGSFGVEAMLQPGIVDGSAIGGALAQMVGGGKFVADLIVIMLILALMMAIMTSMAGACRTTYQGSLEGWLPKYLSRTNDKNVPVNAMRTDFAINLVLLMMSDYLFILAVSNCCYLVFNFISLNAGWLHRVDSAHISRPWKSPNVLLWVGGVLAFVNMVFLGAGAQVWGEGTLRSAAFVMLLVIPIFVLRHYVVDKGKFPDEMSNDPEGGAASAQKLAGVKPYLALGAGFAIVVISNQVFSLH